MLISAGARSRTSMSAIKENEKSENEMSHPLTLITFVPIAGMVLILALPDSRRHVRSGLRQPRPCRSLLIAIYLFENFDTTTSAVSVCGEDVVDARVPH